MADKKEDLDQKFKKDMAQAQAAHQAASDKNVSAMSVLSDTLSAAEKSFEKSRDTGAQAKIVVESANMNDSDKKAAEHILSRLDGMTSSETQSKADAQANLARLNKLDELISATKNQDLKDTLEKQAAELRAGLKESAKTSNAIQSGVKDKLAENAETAALMLGGDSPLGGFLASLLVSQVKGMFERRKQAKKAREDEARNTKRLMEQQHQDAAKTLSELQSKEDDRKEETSSVESTSTKTSSVESTSTETSSVEIENSKNSPAEVNISSVKEPIPVKVFKTESERRNELTSLSDAVTENIVNTSETESNSTVSQENSDGGFIRRMLALDYFRSKKEGITDKIKSSNSLKKVKESKSIDRIKNSKTASGIAKLGKMLNPINMLSKALSGMVRMIMFVVSMIMVGLDAVFAGLAAAITAVSLPVIAVVAGLALLAFGVWYFWEELKSAFDSVVEWFGDIPNKIMDAISSAWDTYTGWWGSLFDGVKNMLPDWAKSLMGIEGSDVKKEKTGGIVSSVSSFFSSDEPKDLNQASMVPSNAATVLEKSREKSVKADKVAQEQNISNQQSANNVAVSNQSSVTNNASTFVMPFSFANGDMTKVYSGV